jgi:hypothetical protein
MPNHAANDHFICSMFVVIFSAAMRPAARDSPAKHRKIRVFLPISGGGFSPCDTKELCFCGKAPFAHPASDCNQAFYF